MEKEIPAYLTGLRELVERGTPSYEVHSKVLSSHYIKKIMSALGQALADNIHEREDRIVLHPNYMLLAGCMVGDFNLVFESIKRGAYIVSFFDITPLMIASFFGHTHLVELLMYPRSSFLNILSETTDKEMSLDFLEMSWGHINATDRMGNCFNVCSGRGTL